MPSEPVGFKETDDLVGLPQQAVALSLCVGSSSGSVDSVTQSGYRLAWSTRFQSVIATPIPITIQAETRSHMGMNRHRFFTWV